MGEMLYTRVMDLFCQCKYNRYLLFTGFSLSVSMTDSSVLWKRRPEKEINRRSQDRDCTEHSGRGPFESSPRHVFSHGFRNEQGEDYSVNGRDVHNTLCPEQFRVLPTGSPEISAEDCVVG